MLSVMASAQAWRRRSARRHILGEKSLWRPSPRALQARIDLAIIVVGAGLCLASAVVAFPALVAIKAPGVALGAAFSAAALGWFMTRRRREAESLIRLLRLRNQRVRETPRPSVDMSRDEVLALLQMVVHLSEPPPPSPDEAAGGAGPSRLSAMARLCHSGARRLDGATASPWMAFFSPAAALASQAGRDAVQSCDLARGRLQADAPLLGAITAALRAQFRGYPCERMIDVTVQPLKPDDARLTVSVVGEPLSTPARTAALALCKAAARWGGGDAGLVSVAPDCEVAWFTTPAKAAPASKDAARAATFNTLAAPEGVMRFPRASARSVARRDAADADEKRIGGPSSWGESVSG